MALTIRNTYSTARNSLQNTYLVRDTVLLDYSSNFNDEITLKGKSYAFNMTLYLLKIEPTNYTEDLLTYMYSVSRSQYGYRSYELHLLPQSRIKFHPCTYKNASLKIYLVKSTDNFTKWKNSQLEFEEVIEPSNFCQNITDDLMTYEYVVKTEDHYYVIFYSIGSITIKFNVGQVLYVVERDNIESQCSLAINSFRDCSLSIPYSSTYHKALLELSSERPSNVIVTTFAVPCSFRDWFYAITCILAAAGVVALMLTVAALLVAVRHCCEKNSNSISFTGERQGGAVSVSRMNRLSSPTYSQSVPDASVLALIDLRPSDTPLTKNPEGILTEQPPPSYKTALKLSEYSPPPPYSSGNMQPSSNC